MNQKTAARLAIWAAVAAMPMFAGSAFAQFQVDNGHALDANNRVGGTGRNDDNLRQGNGQVTGNQIATGNVTNGFAFQGANFRGLNLGTGLSDPTSFRGVLPGAGIDQFIANSTGVPTNSNRLAASQSRSARPFYGNTTTVGPVPSGYVQAPGGGGYVPASTLTTPSIDTRYVSQYATAGIPEPRPGDLLLPGPVDVSAGGSFSPASLAASPLFGGSSLSPGQQQLMQNYSSAMNTIPGQWSASQSLDAFQIMALRRELNQNQTQNQVGSTDLSQPNAPMNSTVTQQPIIPSTTPPTDQQPITPQQTAPPPGQMTAPQSNQYQPKNVAPAAGDFSTGQSTIPDGTAQNLPSPSQQSSLYAQMQQRLKDYQDSHPDASDDSDQAFIADLQSRRNMLNSPAGTQDKPADLPQANSAAGGSILPPVQIGSMAAGVGSKGLADLLKKAEDAVTAEKYDEAIGIYNSAMDVVPNNGMILIGRAHAEIGGSYYRQADADIRAAFRREPILLMAQYDLQSRLGNDRLTAIIANLKQIATDSPDASTPVFLLAYIAYNTHHEDKAAQWLNIAHQRDSQDDVIPLINKYWSHTASSATKP